MFNFILSVLIFGLLVCVCLFVWVTEKNFTDVRATTTSGGLEKVLSKWSLACLLAPRAKSERGKKSEDKLCLGCETSPALVIFVTATITVRVSVFVFVFFCDYVCIYVFTFSTFEWMSGLVCIM